MGEGLRLEVAREMAKEHGVPLEVVLKGWFVQAVDASGGLRELEGMEDHVIIGGQGGGDAIKFAMYDRFTETLTATEGSRHGHAGTKLTVVIMPYADLASCVRLEDLTRAATPVYGYAKIKIANEDILIWKKRDMAVIDHEADKCTRLKNLIEDLRGQLFPTTECRRSARPSRNDRNIIKERLIKAHLDAGEYGYAHDVILLLDKHKHDAIFRGPGSYDPRNGSAPGDQSQAQQAVAASNLELYRDDLREKFGNTPYPELADILRLEAQHKIRTQLADARREVSDVLERAMQELERVVEKLRSVRLEPSLLGCGI